MNPSKSTSSDALAKGFFVLIIDPNRIGLSIRASKFTPFFFNYFLKFFIMIVIIRNKKKRVDDRAN